MRCCVFFFYCFFLRRKAQFGMQHPMLPGAWGEQPHKLESPHENTLALFSKIICASFMPERASFGIKRPVFTRGHGDGASPHIRRRFTNVRKSCAKRTMGVALPLPGRGGGISLHMKAFVCYFLKSLHKVYARKGITWDATSHVAGGVGRAAPQTKALTSKNLCANFPNIPRCFSTFFAPVLCPDGHYLGLNALRLRGGHGAA